MNTEKTPLTCTIKQPGAVHVVKCGHKFDPRNQPRSRCGFCWTVYWSLHPAEVPAGHSIIKVYGKEAIIRSKGEKYFKALRKAIEAYEWKQSKKQLDKPMVIPAMKMTPSQEESVSSQAEATVKSDESSVSSTTEAIT